MSDLNPKVLIPIAAVLVLLGFILPLLMTMQIIESTFFLNFFSYGASLIGIILGMLGAMSIVSRSRNRRH